MSDCYDDYDAATNVIVEEYGILKRLNPRHRLLKLVEGVDSTGFNATRAFSRKYREGAKNHKTPTGKSIGRNLLYYEDLRDAVTTELCELLGKEKGLSEDVLWKKMEERGLVGVVRTHLTHNEVSLTSFAG